MPADAPAPQNPFNSYSSEDQDAIREQLQTALDSGHLNPAQQKGVTHALSFLPKVLPPTDMPVMRAPEFGETTTPIPLDREPNRPLSEEIRQQAAGFLEELPTATGRFIGGIGEFMSGLGTGRPRDESGKPLPLRPDLQAQEDLQKQAVRNMPANEVPFTTVLGVTPGEVKQVYRERGLGPAVAEVTPGIASILLPGMRKGRKPFTSIEDVKAAIQEQPKPAPAPALSPEQFEQQFRSNPFAREALETANTNLAASSTTRQAADVAELFAPAGIQPTKAGQAIGRSPVANVFLPGSEVIRAQSPTGGVLADTLLDTRARGEIRAGSLINEHLKDTKSLTEAEYSNFVDVLQGKATAMNNDVATAARNERSRLDRVQQDAVTAGVEEVLPDGSRIPVQYRSDYYPVKLPRDVIEGRGRKSLAEKLVAAGEAENIAVAEEIIDRYIKPASERIIAGNLQRPRLDAAVSEFARKDRSVLLEYYDSAGKAISQAEQLGPKAQGSPLPQRVTDLLESMRQENPAGYEVAREIVNAHFGGSVLTGWRQQIWNHVSNFEAATKLSRAVLGNIAQPALSSLVLGIRGFGKSLFKTIADYKAAKDFATQSGNILSSVVNEFQRTAGLESESAGSRLLRVTGFSAAERFNRIFATVAGREYAKFLWQKLQPDPADGLARRGMSNWLGLDADRVLINGGLSDADLLMAGHRFSDATQFRYSGSLDLPYAWQSSLTARLLTMYKQFGYSQARMLKRAVWDEVFRHGNLRPLLPLATVIPVIGEIQGDVRAALTGRDRPNDLAQRLLDDYVQASVFGILADTIQAGSYSKGAAFVAGPVGGDIGDVIDVAGAKHPLDKVGKEVLRRVPVVGPGLSRMAFPPQQHTRADLDGGDKLQQLFSALSNSPNVQAMLPVAAMAAAAAPARMRGFAREASVHGSVANAFNSLKLPNFRALRASSEYPTVSALYAKIPEFRATADGLTFYSSLDLATQIHFQNGSRKLLTEGANSIKPWWKMEISDGLEWDGSPLTALDGSPLGSLNGKRLNEQLEAIHNGIREGEPLQGEFYRGIARDSAIDEFDHVNIGDNIKFPRITSFTDNRSIGEFFTQHSKRRYLFKVEGELKGVRASALNNLDEAEIVSNGRFKITGKHVSKGNGYTLTTISLKQTGVY